MGVLGGFLYNKNNNNNNNNSNNNNNDDDDDIDDNNNNKKCYLRWMVPVFRFFEYVNFERKEQKVNSTS